MQAARRRSEPPTPVQWRIARSRDRTRPADRRQKPTGSERLIPLNSDVWLGQSVRRETCVYRKLKSEGLRKFCPVALMSAFGAKADLLNSMIGAECSATACSLNERLWNGKRSPRFHEGEPHARRGCPLSAEQRKTFAHAELSHLTLNSHCIANQILEIQARHALRRTSINKRHKARIGLPCS